jgi:hypothetical protein
MTVARTPRVRIGVVAELRRSRIHIGLPFGSTNCESNPSTARDGATNVPGDTASLRQRGSLLIWLDKDRREPTWQPTLFHPNPLKSFIRICVRELFGSSGSGIQLTHAFPEISSSTLLLGRLMCRVPEDQR